MKACSGEWENSNPSFLQKQNTSSFPSLLGSHSETQIKSLLIKKKIINTF